MLHKITDGDKFVCYVSDAINDQINELALKMLIEKYSETKSNLKLKKPIYKNYNERTLFKSW